MLDFQLKTKPSPFSKEAPVRAVAFGPDGSVGSLQTLTRSLAHEAVARPLTGGRVLALWADKRRLAGALAGAKGRFGKTAAPAGPPPQTGHTNQTNRDLRTAGRYAIFAWRATVAYESAIAASDPLPDDDRADRVSPLE